MKIKPYKKGRLKNFSKFMIKHLCRSLFFKKVAGHQDKCFPVNFPNFQEHLRAPEEQLRAATSGKTPDPGFSSS